VLLRRRQWRAVSILISAATLASGCSGFSLVLGFKEQAAALRQVARIEGRVDTEGPAAGILVVVLATPGEVEGDPPVGLDTYVRIRPGSFAFPVAAGRYMLGAYEDRNSNGLLDPDERAVRVQASPVLEVAPGASVVHDLVIPNGTVIPELTESVDVFDLIERTPEEQRRFSLWSWSVQGTVCEDLGAEIYGPKSGEHGLWRIADFVTEGLAGIYFMEPYDSKRIPVLFVHGISGHPQEFSALIEGIDRTHYQPWFYFYPSGFRIDDLASHLAGLLERLQVRYRFDELAFVTHSMGGLVSRGAILKYSEETERDDVRLFVSISAPWGGHERGVSAQAAPIEVPESFKDLSPTSDYVRWLFYRDEERTIPQTWPSGVDYHLLFSYRMNRSSTFSNDGVISVASQLRSEAQLEAATQRGYDLNHTEILRTPEVLDRINSLLDRRFR
jgi:pimeloyl-ACP methyl ester carboxylesterase